MNTRIRQLRKYLGLTQGQFARKIQYSKSYIQQIEYNNAPVSEPLLAVIVQVTGVREEWMRFGTGKVFSNTQSQFDMAGAGRRLREARLNAGLTQADLAGKVICSRDCISALERGERKLRNDILRRAAAVLDVDYDWMMTGLVESHNESQL
ncbi:MAG: helix-turn-helix transcriptional regulator [Clostridia bacterium]|nr:helix-turn-helix transcriptional regulator [Clostridia bacterium]